MEQTRAALSTPSTIGGTPKLAGVVWVQGEANGYGSTLLATNYPQWLQEFITGVQGELADVYTPPPGAASSLAQVGAGGVRPGLPHCWGCVCCVRHFERIV